MATLKLKKTTRAAAPRAARPPVRGAGSAPRKRSTLAEATTSRHEREAQPHQAKRPAGKGAHPPGRRAPQQDTTPAQSRRAPGPLPSTAAKGRRPPPFGPESADRFPGSAASRPTVARPASPKPKSSVGRPAPQPQPSPRRHSDKPEHVHTDAPGSMRLSKRMSELGLASRREADEWIAKGWVRVDGRVVQELGSRVQAGQRITIDPRARQQQQARVTVLLNKPVGYVSGQAEDGYEPAWVLITPANQWREDSSGIRFQHVHRRGLAPAGRLDIDSVGLLVLTQDGRIARQLIGEDSEIEKEYLVRVESAAGQPLTDEQLALLNHGLELDGEPLKPALVEWANSDQLRFVLREGKKRQIRRMCEAVGLKVVGLKRVRIGAVRLGALPPGQWRYLRDDESFEGGPAVLAGKSGR